jgi:hypothetical protein
MGTGIEGLTVLCARRPPPQAAIDTACARQIDVESVSRWGEQVVTSTHDPLVQFILPHVARTVVFVPRTAAPLEPTHSWMTFGPEWLTSSPGLNTSTRSESSFKFMLGFMSLLTMRLGPN